MQDFIFAAGSLIFIFALVPSLLSRDKPHVWTCFITGTILTIFALTYATMDFTFATITTGINALMWFTLMLQHWFTIEWVRSDKVD